MCIRDRYRTAESFLSSLNKKNDFDISKYQEGQRVYHKKFGEGTINKVEEEGEMCIRDSSYAYKYGLCV